MEEKIDRLLSDPESMSKIMEIAKSLSSGAGKTEDKKEQEQTSALSVFSELNINPGLIETVGKALGGMNGKENKIVLLSAVRQIVKEENREIVDNAIRAFKLAKVARMILAGLERQDTKHV